MTNPRREHPKGQCQGCAPTALLGEKGCWRGCIVPSWGSSVSPTLLSSASCLKAPLLCHSPRARQREIWSIHFGGNQRGDEQAHAYGRMTLPAPLSALHIRCDLQSAMAMLVSISPSSPVLAALLTYGFTHVFLIYLSYFSAPNP